MEIQKMELFDGIHQIEPFYGFHRKSIKWYHFFGKLYVILIFSAFEKLWQTTCGYNTGGGPSRPGRRLRSKRRGPPSS